VVLVNKEIALVKKDKGNKQSSIQHSFLQFRDIAKISKVSCCAKKKRFGTYKSGIETK
jgi:hypothetical protein